MARTTVYNNITSEEKMKQVNPDNIQLGQDFIEYLQSVDRAKSTIQQYASNLNIFWCWNLEFNQNKFFVDLTKREVAKFQNHAINVWGWSPKRIRTVKATISSLGNYIENILDDEFVGYRSIVNKIESPANEPVRERSIFTMEQLQPLLDCLVENKEYEKACMLSLGINSGRRKQELTHFKNSYFTDDNIICEGAFYKTPEKMRTKGRGARGKMLDIYVLKKPFDPYLQLWREERERLGITSDWLFPSKTEDGEPISVATMDYWANQFSRIMKSNFYWHSLRSYYVTNMSKNGIPDNVIQDILGWSSADMVGVYNDTQSEDKFEKYFGADGFKNVAPATFDDL